ncbi:hypothetical protein F2Q69_00026516 [Brassica cretica]|uniref:Uncharacterized protein n=1 Tax=Brassica cretica TaxID=69181 RepID=A0A8S9RUT0_BRACR|nr:hypothetical protein F2Q69_00026516 [Brassica cretica]
MRGGRELFIVISNQSETSRVAARVSLCMALDACAATPRAPHGWLHDLVTCNVTPHRLPVWMHGLAPCKETPRPPHVWPHSLVACIATPRALADPPRAPHGCLHVQVACTAAPHASLDTHNARSLVLNTHSSSHLELLSQLSDIGLPVNFSSRDRSQIFFYVCSDALSIFFNKLQMNPDLRENISRASGFFEKFHNTEILSFSPNFRSSCCAFKSVIL